MNRKQSIGIMLLMTVFLSACSSPKQIVKPSPDYAPVDDEEIVYQPIQNTGSIYQPDQPIELFSDIKAFRVGDVLTITLTEKTDASSKSATETDKQDSIDLAAKTLFGQSPTLSSFNPFSVGAENKRKFSGTADTSQSNSLTGEITVMVTKVMKNGLLKVKGEKILEINQGAEYLRFSGIVRSRDISANNVVSSTKVANARISYGTGGAMGSVNKQGWLTRFFNSEYWPF